MTASAGSQDIQAVLNLADSRFSDLDDASETVVHGDMSPLEDGNGAKTPLARNTHPASGTWHQLLESGLVLS